MLEICDGLRIGLCGPQEDAFGSCVLGPVVIILMIKDKGNLTRESRIQVAELEFSFNFLSCLSCLGYQHLVYPQAGVELLSKEDFLCLGVVREKPPFKYIQPPTSSVAVFIQKVLKSKR